LSLTIEVAIRKRVRMLIHLLLDATSSVVGFARVLALN